MRSPSLLSAAALAAAALAVAPAAAGAVEIGPAPTNDSVRATTGPLQLSTQSLTDAQTNGFGEATVYYPTQAGSYGGVAFAPGFTENKSVVEWSARMLASKGFVTIAFSTNSGFDSPESRGTQLLAALDQLPSTQAGAKLDTSRLAVVGHSMGGGGALYASLTRPSLKAAIGYTPYSFESGSFSSLRVPTAIVSAQFDFTAPNNSNSNAFYSAIPSSTPKLLTELSWASHGAPNRPDNRVAGVTTAWAKYFVDGDQRYRSFVCPSPTVLNRGETSKTQASC